MITSDLVENIHPDHILLEYLSRVGELTKKEVENDLGPRYAKRLVRNVTRYFTVDSYMEDDWTYNTRYIINNEGIGTLNAWKEKYTHNAKALEVLFDLFFLLESYNGHSV